MRAALILALLAGPALAEPAPQGARSRYETCIAVARSDPARGLETAWSWRLGGGGVPARHCLAIAQFEAKHYTESLKSYDAAAQESAALKDGRAIMLLSQGAEAALLARRPEVAVDFLTRALDRPGGVEVSASAEAALRLTRAEALVDLKRETEAAADLEAATKLDDGNADAWLLKATLARRMGRLEDAEAAILRAGTLAPDRADVDYEAGNIAAAQGRMELARKAWTAATEAEPDSPAADAAKTRLYQPQ